MCVRRGEEQSVRCDAGNAAEIAFENAVKKKSKNKFFNHRRDCHRENDDHDPLFDRTRRAEELDDILLARTAPKPALRNGLRKCKQRIRSQQQNCSHADGPEKTDSEKAR